jgi:NAD(P)-dependent dehydrogenase (short-subunit alcohol dehydrogenase family)
MGIGKALALGFANAGADVALIDLIVDDGKLKEVADEVQSFGRRSLTIQADVSKKLDVDNFVQIVKKQFSTIDILVNNVGIIIREPLIDTTEEQWDRVIDIDLKGVFLCSQAAGRVMMAQKRGNIINISSGMAFYVMRNTGAYCIAKAGVTTLTHMLAVELGGYNIRVNAIAPGMIKTDFNKQFWSVPEILERRSKEGLLGRVGEVDDLVGGAVFMASDASSFMTGETLTIDGGVITFLVK